MAWSSSHKWFNFFTIETTDKVKAQTKTSAKVKEVPKKNTKVTKAKTSGNKKATAIEDKPQEKNKGKNSAKSTGKLDLKELLKDGKWKDVLAPEFEQPYFKSLEETLQAEYDQGKEIFPPRDLIFNALHLTPLEKVSKYCYFKSCLAPPPFQ
jgi:hypothetical protein